MTTFIYLLNLYFRITTNLFIIFDNNISLDSLDHLNVTLKIKLIMACHANEYIILIEMNLWQ